MLTIATLHLESRWPLGRAGLQLLVALAIASCGEAALCRAQEPVGRSACDGSTVEDLGSPEYVRNAKLFLKELKDVVRKNDAKKLSTLLKYPVSVFAKNRDSKILDEVEFVRSYSLIITPEIKKAVLDESPDCLFANYQGVMIGRGEIWFQWQASGRMKIITINDPN